MTDPLVTSAKDVSADIIKRWAAGIGSPVLAKAIYNDTRLNRRLLNRLRTVAGAGDGHADERERAGIVTYATDPARIAALCGLIAHGDHLRRNVMGSGFGDLAQNFDRDDLAMACQARQLHLEGGRQPANIDGLVQMIHRTGAAIVATWHASLSDGARADMKLKGMASPEAANLPAGLGEDYAVAVFEHAVSIMAPAQPEADHG